MEALGKKCHSFWSWYELTSAYDNKGKDILIVGKGPKQAVDYITLTAEAIYVINFTQPNKRFGLMEATTIWFVNNAITYHFKAVDSEIKVYALLLCNTLELII